MEDIVSKIIDSLGPRWAQLYSRLGLDYRGRFQITANNNSIAPERVRHRQCALETIRKWQKEDALKEKDEKECMTILLNSLKTVKGLEGLANELANEHGEPIRQRVWESGIINQPPSPAFQLHCCSFSVFSENALLACYVISHESHLKTAHKVITNSQCQIGIELASKSSAGSESHLSSSEDSQREESLDFKSLFQSINNH